MKIVFNKQTKTFEIVRRNLSEDQKNAIRKQLSKVTILTELRDSLAQVASINLVGIHK